MNEHENDSVSAPSSSDLEYDADLAKEFGSSYLNPFDTPLAHGDFADDHASDSDDGEYGVTRRRVIVVAESTENEEKEKGQDVEPLLSSNSFTLSPSAATTTLEIEDGITFSLSNSILSRIYDYLVPPDKPRAVQLFHPSNLAIPTCYLIVGVLQGLSGPLLNVLPLDLGATEAQQVTISALRSLPASFKLVFGFYSDGHVLFGYRRKSYMMIGWCLSGLAMIMLSLSTPKGTWGNSDRNEGDELDIPSSPSIPFLGTMVILFGTGYWFADVMADSVVAEKAKLEPEESRGQLQSSCYACRFFGLMCAAPLSTYMYAVHGPRSIMVLCGVLPIVVMIPLIVMFVEDYNPAVPSTKEQCKEIWSTVCSRAVWQPMSFVYLYNILQIGNAAWREYLKSVLHFTSVELNSLLIAAYILLYLGIIAYKYFFITWSWRSIYVVTTLLNGILSIGQIMLIKGFTFGLSNFWFALGDDAMADFIAGIQFLPTTIMMVHLCPSGSEGASYALFTTVNNSAGALAGAISTNILRFFDVSKETMVSGNLSGLTNLTIVTTLLQTSGIIFVCLLPHRREDLLKLNYSSSSKIGGGIFLAVTMLSLLYSVVVCVLNIALPGWAGES